MDGAHISLFGALALGLVYGAAFCYRGKGLVALLVKTGSTALLALWAYLAGGPVLLVHVAYVALFWGLEAAPRDILNTSAQVVLVFAGAGFARWLSPWLGEMRWPVFAYTAVILMMGAAALRLDPVYWPVTLGAIMFIASDMILSLQLFRKPADQPAGTVSSLAVWTLYFGGQALIAWGMLNALA